MMFIRNFLLIVANSSLIKQQIAGKNVATLKCSHVFCLGNYESCPGIVKFNDVLSLLQEYH